MITKKHLAEVKDELESIQQHFESKGLDKPLLDAIQSEFTDIEFYLKCIEEYLTIYNFLYKLAQQNEKDEAKLDLVLHSDIILYITGLTIEGIIETICAPLHEKFDLWFKLEAESSAIVALVAYEDAALTTPARLVIKLINPGTCVIEETGEEVSVFKFKKYKVRCFE